MRERFRQVLQPTCDEALYCGQDPSERGSSGQPPTQIHPLAECAEVPCVVFIVSQLPPRVQCLCRILRISTQSRRPVMRGADSTVWQRIDSIEC